MKNILIIDDNEIDIFVQSELLKKQNPNCNITSFFNGKTALEYLQKIAQVDTNELPDAIFLDLNMPVMNGWDFIKVFASSGFASLKKIKVVVTSCSIFKREINQIQKINEVNDYVLKPLTMDKVRELNSLNITYC